jgi:hypothetical protein
MYRKESFMKLCCLLKIPHVTKIFGARARRRHERSAWY